MDIQKLKNELEKLTPEVSITQGVKSARNGMVIA